MRQVSNSKKQFLVPLSVLLLCILISSCSSCNPTPKKPCVCEECVIDSCNKDNCLCNEENCKKTPKPILTNTIIIIDGSVSMQGYITPSVSTNFSAVASALEGLVPDSCTEYIFKKNKELISGDILSKSISEKKLKLDGQESDLGAILSDMIDGAISSSCAYFLITDGILSTSNENIRTNREWNKVHCDLLQSSIETIVRKGKNKVASLVLQFEAPFNGYYTAYDNQTKTYLSNNIRPYYVIAIGKPSIMQQVYKDIIGGKRHGFDGIKNIALYGFDFELDQPIIEEDDNIIFTDNGYKVLSTAKKVVISYDISKLPKYILEEADSLKSHIRIVTNGNNGDVNELKNEEQFSVKLDGTILYITIKEKYDLCIPGELEIGIAWWQPSWIERCTTDDDKKPDTTSTFILKHFLYPFSQLNSGEECGYLDAKHIIKLNN